MAYQDALQSGKGISRQLSNRVVIALILGVVLVDDPQSDLGKLEFTNKGITNYCVSLARSTSTISSPGYIPSSILADLVRILGEE